MAGNGTFTDSFVDRGPSRYSSAGLRRASKGSAGEDASRRSRPLRSGSGARRAARRRDAPPPGGRGFDRGRGAGFRPMRPAFIPSTINSPASSWCRRARRSASCSSRYAPTLALVAGGVLVVGALLAAVVIFGPARRRLRGVENAARRLGGGDLTARAPDRGGDEVAAVASAFNAMADDSRRRAEALAASDRARRQLLADVSHELTTPVTAMRGYLETLTMPELAAGRADAGALPRHHRRRNGAPRAHHRRSARPGAARGRRRRARDRRVAGRAAVRPRRGAPRARLPRRRRDDAARASSPAPRRCAAIAIASSRRCRTWPPTRCATRRPAARSSWRTPIASRRPGARAVRRRVHRDDQGPGIAPSTCRTSSIGSTRRKRRARQARSSAAAGSGLGSVDREGDRRAPRRHASRSRSQPGGRCSRCRCCREPGCGLSARSLSRVGRQLVSCRGICSQPAPLRADGLRAQTV